MVEMDSMSYGAIQECKQQGKKPGEDIFIVTGGNGARAALDYIISGELMATATNIPFLPATTMVDIIYDLFVGGREGASESANTPEKASA